MEHFMLFKLSTIHITRGEICVKCVIYDFILGCLFFNSKEDSEITFFLQI